MEGLKKILVYDGQHAFSRFLNKQFGTDYELKIYKKFTKEQDFKKLNEDFSMVLFMVYSSDNLFDFLKVYGKGVPIVVCSYNEEVLKNLLPVSDLMVIDLSKARTELIQNFNLTFYSLL